MEKMLQKFEQQLHKTLSRALSATFDSMLTKITDNVGAKIASLSALVAALDNASLRPVLKGGAGSIEPYKPYFRPP